MRRAVEVYGEWPNHPPDQKRWTSGSGYLIAGRLVLTAAHVVCKAGQPSLSVLVRAPSGALMTAQVRWHPHDHDRAGSPSSVQGGGDVALVEITDPGWVAPVWRHPVRWGRLVTTRPGQSCAAIGFPAVVATPQRRDSHHAVGVLNPGALVKSGLYAVEVTNPPAPADAEGSGWAGMSGAALLAEDLVVGVVIQDPAGFDSRRLVTMPISAVAADPGFARIVTAHVGRAPAIEPVELVAIAEPRVSICSPVSLLRPDLAPTPFRPRVELDLLVDWCLSGPPFDARLLIGPGGQGKTRLARELAAAMDAHEWATVVISEQAEVADLTLLAELREPILIVVDYAESRTEQLEAIARNVTRTESTVRLLLLARTAGWRTELSKSAHLRFLARIPAIQLSPVEPDSPGRQEAWTQAVVALASRLGELDGYRDIDWPQLASSLLTPELSEIRYRVILEVQIDALAALLRAGQAEREGSYEDPMDVILEHERAYWNRAAQQMGISLSDEAQRCVVAYASLYGAASRDEADQILETLPRLGDLGEDARATVSRWLATLYQDQERYWSRPQPDRLAEHLVGTSLAAGICRRARTLERSLADASDGQLEHAVGLLVQALVHYPPIIDALMAIVRSGGLRAAEAAAFLVPRAEQRQPLLDVLGNYIEIAPLNELNALTDQLRHGPSQSPLSHLARTELLRRLAEISSDVRTPTTTTSASKLPIRARQYGYYSQHSVSRKMSSEPGVVLDSNDYDVPPAM